MKTTLGLLFGGKSAEHEVSIQSARSIFTAINKDKYDVILIGIDKTGDWYLVDETFMQQEGNVENAALETKPENKIALIPVDNSNQILNLHNKEKIGKLDVIFSIIHGTLGEDGSLQGYLNVLNTPFVGCDVLGSAVAMDKEVTKRLLIEANIPVAGFVCCEGHNYNFDDYIDEIKPLGYPLFIKPANAGSSVGVKKVTNKDELKNAIDFAFKFDNKVIIEEFIKGREIECSVLGNDELIASVPGEIIPNHEFYSYDAKYIDESGADLKIPAELPEDVIQKIQRLAMQTFKMLCGKGMARVDMFLTEDGEIFINEMNTLPGFTNISMYPKLLELNNIQYSELIDKLIELAIELHKSKLEKERNFKNI